MATGAPSRQQAYMMVDTQEHHAQQAPEVVHENLPEASPQGQYQYQGYPKPDSTGHGGYGGPYSSYSASQLDQVSPRPYNSTAAGVGSSASGEKRNRGCCGCTFLVFVLSAIIALLLAAVIGLAAGTGVEANRANTAEDRLARATAGGASGSGVTTVTVTSSASAATSTSFASLDDNCSGNPDGVTGTTYQVFSLYGNSTFTIKCDKDALGDPLLSIFASDLNTCMDSCAAYTEYATSLFGTNNTNATCGAVSFIPLWTNKTAALVGGAPGNCYLKPTQTGTPNTPDIGTECHAGILNSS